MCKDKLECSTFPFFRSQGTRITTRSKSRFWASTVSTSVPRGFLCTLISVQGSQLPRPWIRVRALCEHKRRTLGVVKSFSNVEKFSNEPRGKIIFRPSHCLGGRPLGILLGMPLGMLLGLPWVSSWVCSWVCPWVCSWVCSWVCP